MPSGVPNDRAPLTRGEILASGVVALLGCGLGMAADVASGFAPQVAFDPAHAWDLDAGRLAPLLRAKTHAEMLAGHYLAVLGIPLGIAGIWQVHRALAWGARGAARAFLWGGVLAYVVGTVYHASFGFVAHFVALREALGPAGPAVAARLADAWPRLLAFHEPLGLGMVAAMPLLSLVYAVAVARGRSAYPRALALLNPVTIQLLLSALAVALPRPANQLVFVTVFNGSMAIFFLVSTLVLWRRVRAPRRPGADDAQ